MHPTFKDNAVASTQEHEAQLQWRMFAIIIKSNSVKNIDSGSQGQSLIPHGVAVTASCTQISCKKMLRLFELKQFKESQS